MIFQNTKLQNQKLSDIQPLEDRTLQRQKERLYYECLLREYAEIDGEIPEGLASRVVVAGLKCLGTYPPKYTKSFRERLFAFLAEEFRILFRSSKIPNPALKKAVTKPPNDPIKRRGGQP